MTKHPAVLDVTQATFASAVLEASRQLPVLVDFWAGWCQPCQMLSPILDRLAKEAAGTFILAKVDTDREQALAFQYGVRSLPTVKLFRNGEVVEEFVGLQQPAVYRAAIERHRVNAVDQVIAQAEVAWQQGKKKQAIELLKKAHAAEPTHIPVTLALADKLLTSGAWAEAAALLHGLPANAQMEAKGLLARLEFVQRAQTLPEIAVLAQRVQHHPDDVEARYHWAVQAAATGDYETALEQFLEIFRRAPAYQEGIARKSLVALFAMLGEEHPLVPIYRRKLSQLLY